jgi:hypothetical protein
MTTTEFILLFVASTTIAFDIIFRNTLSKRAAAMSIRLTAQAAMSDALSRRVDVLSQRLDLLSGKPKRRSPRTSKADLPIRLVPTDPAIPVGERIDLTTPMPERAPTALTIADLTVAPKYDLTTGRRLDEITASGVGGSKPDGEGSAA